MAQLTFNIFSLNAPVSGNNSVNSIEFFYRKKKNSNFKYQFSLLLTNLLRTYNMRLGIMITKLSKAKNFKITV